MDDSSQVKSFFEHRALKFDSYYSWNEKPFFGKVLDFVFRRSMRRRFQLTIEECREVKNAKILDVGCGSGHYGVALIQSGVSEVVGIDFADSMIALARRRAQENKVQGRCRFLLEDFSEITLTERFDIVLALGFFDYTSQPIPYLKRMKDLTTGKIIMTFPAKWRLRNIIRIIRLKILGCPVYFYTSGRIKKILQDVAITDYRLKNIGRDYFVVADVSVR